MALCRAEGHASVYDWVCFFTAEEEDGEEEDEGWCVVSSMGVIAVVSVKGEM